MGSGLYPIFMTKLSKLIICLCFVINIECNRGSYGFECNETCGHCRDVNKCLIGNGSCLTGCDAGFKGDVCKTGK